MGVLGGGKIINMGLLDSFMMQLAKKVGPAYRAACGYRAYGLRYQDLLVETPVVVEAIRRLPPLEQELRTRRLKIANDCAIKQQLLPAHLQTKPGGRPLSIRSFGRGRAGVQGPRVVPFLNLESEEWKCCFVDTLRWRASACSALLRTLMHSVTIKR